jgi:predicted membrane protein
MSRFKQVLAEYVHCNALHSKVNNSANLFFSQEILIPAFLLKLLLGIILFQVLYLSIYKAMISLNLSSKDIIPESLGATERISYLDSLRS